MSQIPVFFLSLDEIKAVFPRLKQNEPFLGDGERQVLWRMEKTLYEHLSLAEIENSLGGNH
ncbi:hypothetical protein AGMMS50230_05830 [Spirochaetia bacterium]|nr:hypothetical protein AGMMS50230_05830 [Spirochaetia bacterium]